MLSFKNDPNLKAEMVARAEEHVRRDMLYHMTYGMTLPDGKFVACSVGCHAHDIKGLIKNAHTDAHAVVANYYGLPYVLIEAQDSIFEEIHGQTFAIGTAEKRFHVNFIKAIPVGVDLTGITNNLRGTAREQCDELLTRYLILDKKRGLRC